jgi:hypothetical protein
MADYERSTRATTVAALPEPLRTAVAERVEGLLLTVPDDAPAYVTHNVRLKKGGLLRRATGSNDPDTEHDVAVIVGPRDVLVAIHGEQRGTSVLAVRLEDAEVSDLSALGVAVADTGVTIAGFPTSSEGVVARGSFFVGLGAPDGDAAAEAVRAAVRAAKA